MITYNDEAFYEHMNKDITDISNSDEINTKELNQRIVNISIILHQLEEHKNNLIQYKSEYSKLLKNKCSHVWEMDYSNSQENRTDYYCTNCNTYKSDLLCNK